MTFSNISAFLSQLARSSLTAERSFPRDRKLGYACRAILAERMLPTPCSHELIPGNDSHGLEVTCPTLGPITAVRGMSQSARPPSQIQPWIGAVGDRPRSSLWEVTSQKQSEHTFSIPIPSRHCRLLGLLAALTHGFLMIKWRFLTDPPHFFFL